METIGNKIMPKLCPIYICNICDYNTNKKSSYDNHLLSAKHKKSLFGNQKHNLGNNNMPKLCSDKYTCGNCNKIFKNRSGLWKHNKICFEKNISIQNDQKYETDEQNTNIYELVKYLMKENSDLKTMMAEQNTNMIEQNNEIINVLKNGTHITNNCNNINSNNKTFNLQVFLNETCKDAMNITDFIDSIKLQLSDLERIGEIGYTQGISDIITSNLQALDVTQRPVHCTDNKRETLYVKDENQWIKEENNKPKIRKMIKHIENKNIQVLLQFREKYPNYADPNSRDSDKYNKTIIEAMGGIGDAEAKENKIIRNISKVTTVRVNE